MALARVKTWDGEEDVTATDLNAEFDNILTKINGNIGSSELTDPFTFSGVADHDGNTIVNASEIFKTRIVQTSGSIQTVIDELEASEGKGSVYLPPGTYSADASGITVPIGINLIGAGSESVFITSAVSGTMITVGDGTSKARMQTISGFSLTAVASNTAGIVINPIASNGRTQIRISQVDIDGSSGAASFSCIKSTSGHGVTVDNCDISGASAYGVELITANGWVIQNSHFNGNDTGIKATSCRRPRTVNNDFEDSTIAHIEYVKCYCMLTDGNEFNGTPTSSDVTYTSSGTTDTTNNIAGKHINNDHLSTAPYALDLTGARGLNIDGNYASATYGTQVIAWNGSSTRDITLGMNQWDEIPWAGGSDVADLLAFGVDGFEEARPDTGTEASFRCVRIPVQDASPTVTNWGLGEKGRMWIVDTGTNVTLEYWDGTGPIRTNVFV